MKNLLMAVLVASNLFLGLGMYTRVSDVPAANAADDRAVHEYLIVPVQVTPTTSSIAIIDSTTRKLLVVDIRGGFMSARVPVDLKDEFKAD